MNPKIGELHYHKCGMEPASPTDGKGCGYLFAHVMVDPDTVSDAEYDRGHLCPRCQAGPWRWVWSAQGEKLWTNMTPEEKARMSAEIRAERARERAVNALGTALLIALVIRSQHEDDDDQKV